MEFLKSIIGPNTIVSFLCFNDFFFDFVFFSGFVVKARIASHHFSKEFILSQSSNSSLFPLFKALIFFFFFFFNISFTKSVKPFFYLRIYFEDFIKKYFLLYTPSERFRRFSLKLQNMSSSPRDKYKKKKIFLGGR